MGFLRGAASRGTSQSFRTAARDTREAERDDDQAQASAASDPVIYYIGTCVASLKGF
jgi:hypothetical protein